MGMNFEMTIVEIYLYIFLNRDFPLKLLAISLLYLKCIYKLTC